MEINHPVKTDSFGYALKIGENNPIYFRFDGYAATVVGTGPKGVGDKVGERNEKSIAYEDLIVEFGEYNA